VLRLHDIFLRKLVLVFLVHFIVLGTGLYFWIKDIYIEQSKIDLLHNISILSTQAHNFDQIDNTVFNIKKETNLRVTIISEDGAIIAESDRDKAGMDNHKNRSEIISAKHNEYGSITRYSDTLETELFYVAKKVTIQNKTYYIRMAREIDDIVDSSILIFMKVASLFLLFAAFALWLIIKVSRDIENETENILGFLEDMSQQNRALSIKSSYSVEFNKITKLLTNTSAKLTKRQKQKSKYTAKLKLSNRQKDDIISAISHEFKNPIAIITGYAQTLIDDKDINPAIRDKFLNKIHNNAHKLSHMIDRLRLSIRLEENGQTYALSTCNIESITRDICDDLELAYPNRDIIISSDKDSNIQADETMIGIAITNLIENAIKYSEDEVRIHITNKSIRIQDSGIGIAQKELSKITKKFYRVSSNSWNNSLGIGLSLVSSIITAHGFTLGIESEQNEGSVFEIVFGS